MQLLKPSWVSADGHAFMSIDIHPDGSRFATGGQGTDCGRVCIWNLKPILDANAAKDKSVPKLLTQMDHHLGCVNVVRWSSDGRFLATGGDDKLVMIWQKSAFSGGSIFGGGGKVHVEQWRLHQTLRGHNGDVLDLAWGPGDVVLATASVDNNIIIWNTERMPEQVTILRGHTSLVKGVFFDPVGKYLASQSDDKTMRIWKTSDWSLETVVEEPFQESGGTTHVLRPGWSPDGSIIVSAHAMNGGGPTAQIVERSSWKANRDFVGHKKAVSCVRFCSKVFDKTNKGNGKSDLFVMVALGSRDRSFSVWTTSLKRPFFVINDAFDQGVLDMSWSSDGKVLLACSMDGSVAAVILSAKEIGTAIPDSKLYDILRERYGKNFGTIANLKTSSVTNGNGPVVIENPDMLKSDLRTSTTTMPTTNGHDSASRMSCSSSKPRLHPQGPTDKQIEARTSDGRRRITPIFIPMSSMENGNTNGGTTSMFGITEFGSSSTQERSKINVEKRNDIVKPNVSPNKCNSEPGPTTSTDSVKKEVKAEAKPEPKAEPKVNVLQAKKKPTAGTTTTASQNATQQKTQKEPPVNIIQVKKKPGQPPAPAQSSKNNEVSPSKKRKRIAVLSDSSSDEEMDTSQSQSNSMKKISEEKKPVASEDPTKGTKLKEAKVKKPDLMTSKSSLEVSPKRPRGRPPLNREYSTEPKSSPPQPPAPSTSSASSVPVAKDSHHAGQKPKSTVDSQPVVPRFKMPSLKMDKCKVYNFTMKNEKINLTVNNNLVPSKLHEVKCQSTKYNWTALLSSHVVTVGTSQEVIVVVCKNGSLHMFAPGDRGQRLFPPLQLPSSVSKLTFESNQLAIVTTCGHLFIWTLDPRPKIKVPKENIQSLVSDDSESYVTKILMKPELIIVTSKGRAFSYSDALGSWLCLSDTSSTIQSCSNFASSASNLPAETANLPLASIGYLTPTQPPSGRLQNSVPAETKVLASITHCRNQRLAAEYLNSPKEYQYWLIAEIKQMAADGDVDGIRNCFDWLMGPVHASATGKKELLLGCLDKHEVLKSCLAAIKGNLHLQRIYIEYNDQINASDQVADIDMLLHV